MLNLKKLKEIREKKGLSQSALARRVGIAPSHYNNVEKGTKGVSTDTLAAIVQVLGVSVNDIWDAENDGSLPPILPIRDNGIIIEKNTNTVRYILPESAEAYQYISQQIASGEIMGYDFKIVLEKWNKISDETRAKILELLQGEDDE